MITASNAKINSTDPSNGLNVVRTPTNTPATPAIASAIPIATAYICLSLIAMSCAAS